MPTWAGGVFFDYTVLDSSQLMDYGIRQATEGVYRHGAWQPGRWLNGDETHQGRQLMLRTDAFSIQRVRLYRYR
ncbi:DUF5597 domain-containing protein [Oxalobacteraceae bacterium A2-2]